MMPFPPTDPLPMQSCGGGQSNVSEPRPNLFFVGLMGAGKTTVGRAVARRLGYPFFDSDHEIEERCGVRIPIIFEHEGEEGFREREAQMIDELTGRQGIVLATGGGAVLRPGNRDWLKARGTVVYLRASPHDLWLRTRHDRNRPLLQTEDPKARLEALYQQRDPLYRQVAHFVIETGRPTVAQLANMVLMQLEMAGFPMSPLAGGQPGVQHAGPARPCLAEPAAPSAAPAGSRSVPQPSPTCPDSDDHA